MQRTRDLSGVGSVNLVIGQRKLRLVEEIENLGPQFQLAPLLQFEVFEDGEVGIVEGWTTEAAAASVAEHGREGLPRSKRGYGEGRGIVPAVDVLAGRRSAAWGGASVVAVIET